MKPRLHLDVVQQIETGRPPREHSARVRPLPLRSREQSRTVHPALRANSVSGSGTSQSISVWANLPKAPAIARSREMCPLPTELTAQRTRIAERILRGVRTTVDVTRRPHPRRRRRRDDHSGRSPRTPLQERRRPPDGVPAQSRKRRRRCGRATPWPRCSVHARPSPERSIR